MIGVLARNQGRRVEIEAGAVILACGGFESNPEMRARYLGPGWDQAKVRGTRYNMGAGLMMALRAGAQPYGNWSGCHSVAWDINAPPFGDLTIGDQFQKHNYPFGIVVNARGERFVDEGANFHSHTYAKYGGEILKQPGMYAWQVFDAKAQPSAAQRISHPPRHQGGGANPGRTGRPKLTGVDPQVFLKTARAFNAACDTDTPFNPNILDGRSTNGLTIDKIELGQSARYRAIPRLSRHHRHYLHLRWAQGLGKCRGGRSL